jgi:hypothetical protein
MSACRRFAVLAGALGATALALPALGQGRALQHDPFVRPAVGLLPGDAPSAATPGRVKAAPPGNPKLSLQAVLVAGPQSIANVDGVMVRVGESINGYRLLGVEHRSAVFEKNGAKFTLRIGGAK